jgi:ubiquinone/menaquinone biosynthesis C-methylase UbiE
MAGRYMDAALPALPFKDKEFDITLCSHFLFLYSEQLTENFHFRSIKELCRVSSEVRIFPLLELGTRKSRHLEPIIKKLNDEGIETSVERVPYEFQKNGNEMLKISVT